MSHFQSHKTYKYENTWMINFPLISSVKLHSRPTHLTEHSLITFRCCFSILTETLNPNTHHAIVLHLPQRHHVMETWSVLLPLKPLALGVVCIHAPCAGVPRCSLDAAHLARVPAYLLHPAPPTADPGPAQRLLLHPGGGVH